MVTTIGMTPAREKALAIVPVFSGSLSLLGSTWIIVEILTNKIKLHTVYNRLLLSMSILDVFSSIAHMLGPIPMPVDTQDVAWAFGTRATCTAQGFFVQLEIVAPLYYVCLSFYYILIIKYEVTADKMKEVAEPIMHCTVLLFGFGTCVASIAMDLFNSTELWCWIAPYPSDCDMNDALGTCERGKGLHAILLFYAPLWLSMFIVLGLNAWIYRTILRRERKAKNMHAIHHEKYGAPAYNGRASKAGERNTSVVLRRLRSNKSLSNQPSRRLSFTFGNDISSIFISGAIQDDDFTENSGIDRPSKDLPPIIEPKEESQKSSSNDRNQEEVEESQSRPLGTLNSSTAEKSEPLSEALSSFFFIPSMILDFFSKPEEPKDSFFVQNDDNQNLRDIHEQNFRDSLMNVTRMVLPEKIAKKLTCQINQQRRRSSIGDSTRSSDARFVLQTVEAYPSAAKQYAATYHIGARVIFYQSIAYVLGFYMIWLFPTINRFVVLFSDRTFFWLSFSHALFQPLQGFFNLVIYRLAHYLREKELHPQWTRRQLLWHTLSLKFQHRPSDFVIEKNIEVAHFGSIYSDQTSGDFGGRLPNDATLSNDNSGVLRRMSSLLATLMTEYTDDPHTVNQNFMEIIGDDLFSSPPPLPTRSKFPTVYANQKFSGRPSSYPVVVPMTDFPEAQSSVECIESPSNEDDYSNATIGTKSIGDGAQADREKTVVVAAAADARNQKDLVEDEEATRMEDEIQSEEAEN